MGNIGNGRHDLQLPARRTARTAHVRQITGSSYLPDCRAYELVSPGYAGAVQLLPGEALTNFAETFGGAEFAQSPQNFGYASSPSRFVYWGGLGSVNEIDTPNSLIDIYLATRTNSGWVTTMPGLQRQRNQILIRPQLL